MMDEMKENFPNLLKSYPSSNPILGQKYLAELFQLKPENLILGNGATELIVAMNATLIDAIAQSAAAANLPSPRHTERFVTLR